MLQTCLQGSQIGKSYWKDLQGEDILKITNFSC